jgi:hypothetical protein
MEVDARFCASGLLAHAWERTTQPDVTDFVCRCTGRVRHYDPSVLEAPNCPRCGQPLKPGRMSIRRCRRCGLVA